MKEQRQNKAVRMGKTGLTLAVLVALIGGGMSGCEWDTPMQKELSSDGVYYPCPPKMIMQKDGYLVTEGTVNIGVNGENGFYYPNPTYVYCDEGGNSIEEKNGDIKKGFEKIKASSGYDEWEKYYNWIVKEGAEYRLTSENEVVPLYNQIKEQYFNELEDYPISYIKIDGVTYEQDSGKFEYSFKYGYCPRKASRCSKDESGGEIKYFCENLVTCKAGEHYDGVSECLPDSVNKCGSETNDCTKISGWLNGDCSEDGECVAKECKSGYLLKSGKCESGCKDGEHLTVEGICEINSVQNCGSHGTDCAITMTGWEGGNCIDGKCVATSCTIGYHLQKSDKIDDVDKCVANTKDCCGYTSGTDCRVCSGNEMCSGNECSSTCTGNTKMCGSGGDAYCANTDTDMGDCGECGKKCTISEVENSTSVVCNGGVCIANECDISNNYHLNGTMCEEDSVQNCGRHGNDCSISMTGWADGRCEKNECIATSCIEGYNLKDGEEGKCEANTHECCGRNENGACQICQSNEMCSGNMCSSSCTGGTTMCGSGGDAYCANLTSDINDCGDCGNECVKEMLQNSVSVVCQNSVCVATSCDTTKAHLYGTICEDDSVQNCGLHGNDCSVTMTGWKDGTCTNGACIATVCDTGYRLVSGKCVANTKECCGYTSGTTCRVCSGNEMCSGNTCSSSCTGSTKMCGSGASAYCANIKTDMNDCGGCGEKCSTSKVSNSTSVVCQNSVCVATACDTTKSHLNGTLCETDSVQNCGRHGNDCSTIVTGWAGGKCENGACIATSCEIGYHLVSGKCVANTKDCCGYSSGTTCRVCSGNQMCSGDTCSSTCTSGTKQCGSGATAYCANTNTDMSDCGGCNEKCTTTKVTNSTTVVCSGGNCIATACDTTKAHLNGTVCETDSEQNCGRHGNNCSTIITGWAGGKCENGTCVATSCEVGYHLASGKCVANTKECCGYTSGTTCRVCSGNEMCSGNTCSSSCTGSTKKCGSGASAYCANTNTDMSDCGGCGYSCTTSKVTNSTTVVCSGGDCIATACDTTKAHLNGTVCETDTIQNCGRHGNICSTIITGWAGGNCENGTCIATSCEVGYHLVNGKCVANTKDCCGYSSGTTCHVCSGNQMCSGDTCSSTCTSGTKQCGSGATAYCANTNTDMNDCGDCGEKCTTSKVTNSTTVVCSGGSCIATACDTATAHLYGTVCEIDSKENCGRHGNDCSQTMTGWAGGRCTNGACVATSCSTGYHLVSGKCVANTKDCCGYTSGTTCRACSGNQMCSGDTCSSTCTSGTKQCGSGDTAYCANTNTDMNDCGDCGEKCTTSKVTNSTTVVCSDKTCLATACNTERAHLYNGGCEVNSKTHCGSHGYACSSLEGWSDGDCEGGACVATRCASGYHVASGKCVLNSNTCCGLNGTTCIDCTKSNQMCNGTSCVTSCPSSQVECNGVCVTTYNDRPSTNDHCGTCDEKCNVGDKVGVASVTCSNAVCTPTSCITGYSLQSGVCTKSGSCTKNEDCTIANAASAYCDMSNYQCKVNRCQQGYEIENEDSCKACSGDNVSTSGYVCTPCSGNTPVANSEHTACVCPTDRQCGSACCNTGERCNGNACEVDLCVGKTCNGTATCVAGECVCANGVYNGSGCVECVDETDCAGNSNGSYCRNNECVECIEHNNCTGNPNGSYCNDRTHKCVECTGNNDCSGNSNGSYCSNNKCVECTKDSHCSGMKKCNNNVCE